MNRGDFITRRNTFAARRAEVCVQVASELMYATGSWQDKVCGAACEYARELPLPASAYWSDPVWSHRELRKAEKRARKQFERDIYSGVSEAVNANPEAYGFVPGLFLGLVVWWCIQAIVMAVAGKLFLDWYAGRL